MKQTVEYKFPLTKHKRGWVKKINGRVVFVCGNVSMDEALQIWFNRKEELYAKHSTKSETPLQSMVIPTQPPMPQVTQPAKPSPTVQEVAEAFKRARLQMMEEGKFKPRSYTSMVEAIDAFENSVVGPVNALMPENFARYRSLLAQRMTSPFSINRHVSQVRAMFRWAKDYAYLIDTLPRWGMSFKKSSAVQIRRHTHDRQRTGKSRIFTPQQVHTFLDSSRPDVRAMVLLGINCAFTNSDIADVTIDSIDFIKGVVEFPRPKNENYRRAILWPETMQAIRDALPYRARPQNPADDHRIFLTRTGLPWIVTRKTQNGKIITVDHLAGHLARRRRKGTLSLPSGCSFYKLRATLRTVSHVLRDKEAVNLIMGHADHSVAAINYVHFESPEIRAEWDDRLRAVSDHVHSWLFCTKR